MSSASSYVPRDRAFGLTPGTRPRCGCRKCAEFCDTVTRVASASQRWRTASSASANLRCARPRHLGQGERWCRQRRPGDPQSAGRHRRGKAGQAAAGGRAERLRLSFDEIDQLRSRSGEDVVKFRVWALAAAGTGIGALLAVIYSQDIHHVFDPLWGAITANRHPPQMVAGHLSEDDWSDRSNVSRKFTALLEQQFPAGTLESQLRSKLMAKGFKSPPPSFGNECQRPIQIEPIGTVSLTCSYPANVLRYGWGVGLICGASLSVMWSTEDRVDLTGVHLPPRIARVVGEYYRACL